MRRMLLGLLAATVVFAQGAGKFELLGKYRGLGGLVASAVGPGPTAGSERLYLSYLYIDNTIEVVSVDPATGAFQVFPNPAPTETGARCMAVGPDGNVYLGTLTGAHFYKLDVKAGKLIDLGKPAASEQYIWDVNFGPDGKLYGATYPQSKLVRYDPTSGKLEDLGRMDDKEQYAHYVAGVGDFVYVGIGTSRQNIVAYKISTGEHKSILPAEYQTVGQANIYPGRDGNVYGAAAGKHFRLKDWTATVVPAGEAVAAPRTKLRDGRTVSVSENTLRVGTETRPFGYEGNFLQLFRIAFGPDGELYGSSVLPIHLVKLDRAKGTLPGLGGLGGGEIYSFLARGKQLLMAAYAGLAPLMVLDTTKPFNKAAKNPAMVNFGGSDSSWRPQSMINGPGGNVYIGAMSGYGKLGGPLTVWNPDSGSVEQFYHLIKDQSVITLTAWKDLIVGGTSVGGGGGSHPTQREAKLFVWNPKTKRTEFEMAPLPGVGTLDSFITAPNGLVYGFGGGSMLIFNPDTRTVKSKPLPFRSPVYSSVAMGPDGRIWGLTSRGIFAVDTKTDETVMVAEAPQRITAGFELRDGAIYFCSGPAVYRYQIPVSR